MLFPANKFLHKVRSNEWKAARNPLQIPLQHFRPGLWLHRLFYLFRGWHQYLQLFDLNQDKARLPHNLADQANEPVRKYQDHRNMLKLVFLYSC